MMTGVETEGNARARETRVLRLAGARARARARGNARAREMRVLRLARVRARARARAKARWNAKARETRVLRLAGPIALLLPILGLVIAIGSVIGLRPQDEAYLTLAKGRIGIDAVVSIGWFAAGFLASSCLTTFHFFCAMCDGPGYLPKNWRPVSQGFLHKILR